LAAVLTASHSFSILSYPRKKSPEFSKIDHKKMLAENLSASILLKVWF